MKNPYLTDIDEANVFLEAATNLCIFRTSQMCWEKCKCQDYCRPWENGLTIVADLKEI